MTTRLTIALLLILTIASYAWYRHSHHRNEWDLVGCKVDDSEFHDGTKITLRGPSLIEAEGDSHQPHCGMLLMGMKFNKREGAICADLPNTSGDNPFRTICYEIVSETQR